jgi:hypothetical protein
MRVNEAKRIERNTRYTSLLLKRIRAPLLEVNPVEFVNN